MPLIALEGRKVYSNHESLTRQSPRGATGESHVGCVICIKNVFRIIGDIKTLEKLKIFLFERLMRMMFLLIFDITDNTT